MLKISKTEVHGWKAAVRGMRNPMNSWDKSDSIDCRDYNDDCDAIDDGCKGCPLRDEECYKMEHLEDYFRLGRNDLKLMKKLAAAGTDHRKFMRFIIVTCDIESSLYWWKEFDTYKVGTVANSCSTMHKIHAKEFTLDDFSTDHLEDFSWNRLDDLIGHLNICRKKFIETKDKSYWWQMIQLLPSSFNQKRTVLLNYEVLANIYKSRRNHKLDEWHEFCDWIESLPYSEIITGERGK